MLNFKTKMRHKAFTLIEALLSVTLIGIIFSISAPLYRSLHIRNDLDIAAMLLAQSLRQAQSFSQGAAGDSSWGVKVESGAIVLFKGTNFITDRDPAFDEVYEIASTITTVGSPVVEVAFNKLSGEPITPGGIKLTAISSESKTVNINSKGMIEY